MPFSRAHEITGKAVRYCEDHGITLEGLTPPMLAEIDATLDPSLMKHMSIDAALAARSAQGGTAPDAVRRQIDRLAATLASLRTWTAETVR